MKYDEITILQVRAHVKKINQEMREMLIEHRTQYAFHQGMPHWFVDDELTAITTLTRLSDAVALVAKSKSSLFKVSFSGNLKVLGFTDLGKRFFFDIQSYYQWVIDRMRLHKLSPALAFVESKFSFILVEGSMSQRFKAEDKSLDDFVCKLNVAIEDVRAYLASSQYKRDVNNYTRSSRKNYASLKSLARRLFQNNSRLMVIRVDFGYRSASDIMGNKPVYVTSDQAVANRDSLLRALKNKYPSLKGYAWCMEYGVLRGFHFHAIFFLDSRANPRDINVANEICDLWRVDITKFHGFAFNCNAVKARYKSCGIGIIDHFNKDAMAGLFMAFRYMTKPDEVMKLQVTKGFRSFGRSIMPPLKTEKRGRKRVSEIVAN